MLGVQVDLLPSLMVYASLTCGQVPLALLAGTADCSMTPSRPIRLDQRAASLSNRICHPALSGLAVARSAFCPARARLAASMAAPCLTLLLLLNTNQLPVIGWSSLWQCW